MVYYYVNQFTKVLEGPVDLTPGPGGELPYTAISLPQALPPADAGYVWVWHNDAAVQLIDLRNKPFYRKDSGIEEYVLVPGPLPDYLTDKPYPGMYYFWLNDDWVLDVEAQYAGKVREAAIEQDIRLSKAVIRVAPLQFAYDFYEASATQVAALLEWKRYTINLGAIDKQPTYPLAIVWPDTPQVVTE
ncbi:Caudovirales tail fiber assembly protein [compost metagenome]